MGGKKDWERRLEELLNKLSSTRADMNDSWVYGEITNFVEKELDRAREEGIKDGMRGMIDILCEKGCGSMFAVIEEKDVNKKIKDLSKLTTK